ncbi:hypothetical protein P7K49_008770 [Saguinus oedipus]|uniref:Uncharacterized protein n=1 Tax=Saguinus oedipus TaxID=9490 RepID=A0ABQ9W0B0_SAGOE|nr:hypothetical protein P7K49_008770 [Saguinus oedipus]
MHRLKQFAEDNSSLSVITLCFLEDSIIMKHLRLVKTKVTPPWKIFVDTQAHQRITIWDVACIQRTHEISLWDTCGEQQQWCGFGDGSCASLAQVLLAAFRCTAPHPPPPGCSFGP